jgi:hypothetical protein
VKPTIVLYPDKTGSKQHPPPPQSTDLRLILLLSLLTSSCPCIAKWHNMEGHGNALPILFHIFKKWHRGDHETCVVLLQVRERNSSGIVSSGNPTILGLTEPTFLKWSDLRCPHPTWFLLFLCWFVHSSNQQRLLLLLLLLFRYRKPRIQPWDRFADHATPSIRESWH